MAKSAAPEQRLEKPVADSIPWLDGEKGYALGIEAGKLVCRNPAGKKLASVPKELKESELAERLTAMSEWLADHRTDCLRRVEVWMLRSLPVPCDVARAVWPDPDWAEMLRNLVVTPADARGKTDATQTGILRDVDPKKGVGVVDRDGETQWISAVQILIPHPILIDGLDELREIAVDMGFSQAIEQIFRPTFAATKEQKELSRITDFSNGRFEQLNFASAHCGRLGYPVRGGYACSKVWENAKPIEARYWIGSDSPELETSTGDLIFVDADQKPLKIADVGAVAFSEGVRMASRIFAKRKVDKQEGGEDVNAADVQLQAGGLLPAKANVDPDATEKLVARAYRHPALGDRPVIRLASDRLGQAEDLAMEFLGFEAPVVSAPLAVQQRQSLGFAAWALINDPANARFALDLVKTMKAAARQARSKPGHAWDAYTVMATELGRSARHFLPPFWEEVGRTFKDLGNQTYAGRALNKSLESERVHALESDRARRRDVVLEFVLAGCLTGNALSEYAADLKSHYAPAEAFAIFRDLCVRRTRGGMSPWAALPKDFTTLAKAAELDGDRELEKWLEEVIEAPAMGRAPIQFWKTCGGHCKRIVGRDPAFAVALLRHTRPEARFYGESKLGPWIELLQEWGVLEFLWTDEHRGAPPLGEPVAAWFGRVVRDEVPAPARTLEMLEKILPRLRKENVPLALAVGRRHGADVVDIDVLEACLRAGVKVDDPPPRSTVTFSGWLAAGVDHPLRNQDIVESAKDERFKPTIIRGLEEALTCRGGSSERGYRQSNLEQRAFPLAAGDRPGIKELWRLHTSSVIAALEQSGLPSFELARTRLASTLWPDALRLFPDIANRLKSADPVAMLQRTLQAGVFDEYGLPALEEVRDRKGPGTRFGRQGNEDIHLTFPDIVVSDKIHAFVIGGDGKVKKYELHLPKKCEIVGLVAVAGDLAVNYRDDKYEGHFYWVSDPRQHYDAPAYNGFYGGAGDQMATLLEDGSVFLGQRTVRPGDKQMPQWQRYLHDGERFWRTSNEYDPVSGEFHRKVSEIDPHTGKPVRDSVPPWFEETEGGTIEFDASDLRPAPAGALESPLGTKDGMLGWKVVKRRDASYFGQGIDGRRWDKPLIQQDGTSATPVALLRQPGTTEFLPVAAAAGIGGGHHTLWDPSGSTIVADLVDFAPDYAHGQAPLLPIEFWHFLRVRDLASSRKLRRISHGECAALLEEAAKDRAADKVAPRGAALDERENPLTNLLPAVKRLFPTAPERMAVGIARVIERAGREIAAFAALVDTASADSTKETASAASVVNRKSDMAATHWGMPKFHVYGHEGSMSISQHLAAAARFLKGNSEEGDLPSTDYLWFSMLEDPSLRCWQSFWRATAAKMTRKDNSEVAWLEFLKLWGELGIAELPGQFAIMDAQPKDAKKGGSSGYLAAGTSFAMTHGEDRFIFVANQVYHFGALPYQVLRYSTAKSPGNPPGFEVKNLRKIKAEYDPAEIEAFISAAESCTAPPLPSPAELEASANRLSASPAEIGLIWLGGLNIDSHEHSFLPGELRTALGLKTADASAGRQALRNLNPSVRTQVYNAVVSRGCAVPFADDRESVLRLIEKAWQAAMPKRLQLDAVLQARLSALGRTSTWHRVAHEALLAAAADPAKHPLLEPRPIQINVDASQNFGSLALVGKNKSEPVIGGDFLQSILQLVALVHAETAAGHPARAGMPALIEQTRRLLDDSKTMLALRAVHIYDDGRKKRLKPAEWLNKHVGEAKDNAKDGTARFDDGLIAAAALDSHHEALIAYRPAKLRDQADLARLHGILAVDIPDGQLAGDGYTSVVAAIKSPGFQKLEKAILAKDVPAGQWPQNPNRTAPAVVKAIRAKYKLGEEAATLYAQVLAVPDPTTAKVREWNGWTAAQLKSASAELVARKLVLEAVRDRAGRSIFLPGEWAVLKAPWLPIESWKLAHLVEIDMKLNTLCPAGGPMVLRPFEDLFAAAWQRVVDGDGPRYEEVKRRKKAK